jgi:putative ABC transport system ATP-binding protein
MLAPKPGRGIGTGREVPANPADRFTGNSQVATRVRQGRAVTLRRQQPDRTQNKGAMPVPGTVVRTRAVARTYRRGSIAVPVLAAVDLEVAEGEWAAVLGPSGSGKSTLLNILGLLDRPDAGVYELAGEDVSDLGDTRRAELRNRRIGFVFQSFNLLPRTSALENVAAPLLYRGMRRTARLARARQTLKRVGLADRVDYDPSQLSGGQLQRVAIARALVGEPALLLADEPTGNLDSRSGTEVLDLFAALHAAGSTVLMITHDPVVAGRAQRRLLLDGGRLHAA